MGIMTNPHRLTLRDIAKQAGVSYQTVSRVINKHPYVADETRQRVSEIIAELDYHPNKAARSLAGHRANTIALVASDIQDYGPSQVVINIERAAKAAGYDLVLSIAADTSTTSMRAAINSVLHWQVDGILILKPIRGVSYEEMVQISGGLPIVQINSQPDQIVPSLMIDQDYGTRLLLDHLLNLGHRDFCTIFGPSNYYDAIVRQVACESALHEHGLRAVASREGDWSAASGYAAMRSMLGQGVHFTAVFAANDQMALGAMRALREHDLRIPEDVSIVGFDDVPEAAFFEPPLTTIQQNFALLGENSIAYLVECIEKPNTPAERRLIPPGFVQRLSTASPRMP
jgi:DNA-binding LacI/PurR family transcriptional regulator